MKIRLKKLTQFLIGMLNGNISKKSIQQISVLASVLCAIYSIKRVQNKYNNICSKDASVYIENQYPILYNEFLYVKQSLSKDDFNKICEHIQGFYSIPDPDENIISWVYQYLKRDLEKHAFGNIGNGNNKIEGNDILFTTQFFTDEYMVKHLVDKVFDMKKEQIPNVLFVDPASGGGNFLTYTFNKLYEWYYTNTNQTSSDIIKSIFSKNLLGYDLDTHLAKIASLSLYVNAFKKNILQEYVDIYIYGGVEEDIYGYLANDIKSNIINKQDFNNVVTAARRNKMDLVFITNPPFMGKRDMDRSLKTFLTNQYPTCKGDLCVSFIYKLMQDIKHNDIIAVVSQNSWLNLSSLKLFRKELLKNYHIHECVDLGSNAFVDISGEKTNVVLCTIGKQNNSTLNAESVFINLKSESHKMKVSVLTGRTIEGTRINSSLFLDNSSYEICYQLENNFSSLKALPTYGSFARCMQGTSTGNNKEFIKYIWEPVLNPEEWRLVSKGGGYSKWNGLNYFKVKWGKDASLIKANPGSALRNIEHINNTDLVYSDTGTLGLNVRLLEPGQVFMASGPGIMIKDGKPLCHMAFLNSRIATFLLKVRNPKFTISAGYISSLPIVESLLHSENIEKQAKACVKYKKSYLSNKLPNIEFKHDDYSKINNIDDYVIRCIVNDIANDLKRYKAEFLIDKEIATAFNFSKEEMNDIYIITGGFDIYENNTSDISIEQLDIALSSTLNENCMSVGKRINGFAVGSESILEVVGYNLSIAPERLYDIIIKNASELNRLKNKYKTDLLHKIIIYIVGLETLEGFPKIITLDYIEKSIELNFPVIYRELSISKEIIQNIITTHHPKSFLGRPMFILNIAL